ncbi:MAG: cation transporter [Elainella sp. Prado103]|jgi:cation diffusion facilitator family transporter|nr:cation transporter [Elainella sp. Prado103]
MADCGCKAEAEKVQQATLRQLLWINAAMFLIELGVGTAAHSTALLADSLDMLADATVYGIALLAIGRSIHHKIRAAFLSGIFQITLAGLILLDVLRKWLNGSAPEPIWMIGVGILALMANLICLWLIARHRQGEVHLRASWIFSKNDVIANLGVIGAGLLVHQLQSQIPDLVVGLLITLLVLRGGIQIVQDARQERSRAPSEQP